jgi:acetyltransferase-like isoleucine patch superfamily enzyme
MFRQDWGWERRLEQALTRVMSAPAASAPRPRYLKRLVVAMLMPMARAIAGAEGMRRAWAHARLRSQLSTGIDRSIVVLGPPEIRGTGQITLGRDLMLYGDLYLETQAGGSISIGDRVVMSRGVHIVSFAQITIGDGSMIGEYASLRDANHRVVKSSLIRDTGHIARAITVGRNVWIGRGVCVLPGVTIGDNAVVGANAVVTRDVRASARVAGVPAIPLQGN